MGIDAEVLVRIKDRQNWLTEERCAELAYELSSSMGWDRFLLLRKGEGFGNDEARRALNIVMPFVDEYGDSPELVGKIVYVQDGPEIIADEGEQFVSVSLMGRYYGSGYERGDWPFLRTLFAWLNARIPQGEVWYGGDSSGVCAQHMTLDKIAEIDGHWFAHGRRPYVHSDKTWLRGSNKGFAGTEPPTCDLCLVPMADSGGSQHYDFWVCDGCGAKITKHIDGREARAENPRFHRFPTWNDDGTVQQHKDF